MIGVGRQVLSFKDKKNHPIYKGYTVVWRGESGMWRHMNRVSMWFAIDRTNVR